MRLQLETPVDHIVSFLCILHIPDREALFKKAAATLKPGGTFYIEDFFARAPLAANTAAQLRDVVSCPYLPSETQYIRDLHAAGFTQVRFEPMSSPWAAFVHARALAYRQSPAPDASLALFYDTVDALFASGQLGGVRITCTNAP